MSHNRIRVAAASTEGTLPRVVRAAATWSAVNRRPRVMCGVQPPDRNVPCRSTGSSSARTTRHCRSSSARLRHDQPRQDETAGAEHEQGPDGQPQRQVRRDRGQPILHRLRHRCGQRERDVRPVRRIAVPPLAGQLGPGESGPVLADGAVGRIVEGELHRVHPPITPSAAGVRPVAAEPRRERWVRGGPERRPSAGRQHVRTTQAGAGSAGRARRRIARRRLGRPPAHRPHRRRVRPSAPARGHRVLAVDVAAADHRRRPGGRVLDHGSAVERVAADLLRPAAGHHPLAAGSVHAPQTAQRAGRAPCSGRPAGDHGRAHRGAGPTGHLAGRRPGQPGHGRPDHPADLARRPPVQPRSGRAGRAAGQGHRADPEQQPGDPDRGARQPGRHRIGDRHARAGARALLLLPQGRPEVRAVAADLDRPDRRQALRRAVRPGVDRAGQYVWSQAAVAAVDGDLHRRWACGSWACRSRCRSPC